LNKKNLKIELANRIEMKKKHFSFRWAISLALASPHDLAMCDFFPYFFIFLPEIASS
jgi:hypothetical protein